jgi:DNA-binding transcriptional MerR regulator
MYLPDVTDVTDDALTIDELARRTGMTVRNIRAHQSRGLLPAPEVRGRTGYYGPEHLARIELIRELQSEGFNLEAIRRLVTGTETSAEVLRFTRTVRAPFEDEQPQIVEAAELIERFGTSDPKLLRRAEKLGLLRPLGDGRYEEMSPRLARAGEELSALGVPAEVTIEVVARLRRHADGVARNFVRLFLEQVWKPFDEAGRPDERWSEVQEALERLRPLASEALVGMFQLAMNDAVDHAFGEVLEREAGSRRKH